MYAFDSRVRYSEVDKNGVMTLEAIMNYFQDCSIFHSEEIGFGVPYLTEHKRAWVLLSWQIEVERYPKLGEKITISTKAYDFKRSFGYRNLMLQDAEGNYIAYANSIWMYMNMEKMLPDRVEQEHVEAYTLEEKFPMEYKDRKILIPKEGGTVCEPFSIGAYQIDTNGHVNNVEYFRIAMRAIGTEMNIASLRAEYKKSAMLGDTVYPVVFEQDTGYVISLNQEDGNPYAIIMCSC